MRGFYVDDFPHVQSWKDINELLPVDRLLEGWEQMAEKHIRKKKKQLELTTFLGIPSSKLT